MTEKNTAIKAAFEAQPGSEAHKAAAREMARIDAERGELNRKATELRWQEKAIPDAPFKKSWHELTLRRMLRYAAENGFDRLTWTTGDQQAARYDLSKQLDSLTYEAQGDSYRITGAPKGKPAQEFGTFTAGQLEDAIGKEMAEKIRAERAAGKDSGTFEGDGLKIGGEGMRGFYDKILPQFADKFGRKFGARVESTTFDVSAGRPTEYGSFDAWQKAKSEGIKATVHSLPITDQMRSALLYEGQPLFQGEKGAVSFLGDGRALIHALQAPDFTTLVHELAHVFEGTLNYYERRDFGTWMHSLSPGSKWNTQQREHFARAFERYLAEGKAPAPELQGVFDKARQWLIAIYQRIAGTAIDVKMNDQVRAAFDRMLFTAPLKKQEAPEVTAARTQAAAELKAAHDELEEILELTDLIDPGTGSGFDAVARLLAEGPDAVGGFMRAPENVSRTLADMFEAEAAGLESATAENLVIDGNQLEATISTAADWYLEKNRALRSGQSDSGKKAGGVDKQSVVNALRRAATGDFARLTPGQQEMVLAAVDAIARKVQPLVREIDVQDLQVGDRYATADLGQRVVVGEKDGRVFLDDGQVLDMGGTTQILGEIDRTGRPDDLPESVAEHYLQQQGDFEMEAGVDSAGNPLKVSARQLIDTARGELAKAQAQEHLYKRAAFCLNLG